jgi:hypothetical protein
MRQITVMVGLSGKFLWTLRLAPKQLKLEQATRSVNVKEIPFLEAPP